MDRFIREEMDAMQTNPKLRKGKTELEAMGAMRFDRGPEYPEKTPSGTPGRRGSQARSAPKYAVSALTVIHQNEVDLDDDN
jgi:hypothetical protein